MGLVAVTWQNCLRKRLPLKIRFLHMLKGDQLGQILMSPPLSSLDLPDIWTPNSLYQSIPAIHKSSNEQTAVVLDGKLISMEIKSKIAGEVRQMKKCLGKVPGLAVILVGQRRDSQTYVRNKIMACEEVGIKSLVTELPTDCAEAEVYNAIMRFNKDPSIHGILVQLPLPQRHHATVTIIHAFTKNPEQITSEADIVVSAAGVPNLVRGNWIKPGATVIDIGTSPVEDLSCEDGYRLIGDVCYEEAVKVASVITPVPGGVGPMTIAMLLFNTLDSAKRMLNFT